MNATLDTVFNTALKLPEASRLRLVERIIATLPADPEIEREQLAVAEARLADMRSGAVRGVPVEEAIQRVRQSLSTRP
jgi:putative addiction module component (TIGR02574 family)